jgi:hypothetical protein
MTTTLTDRYVWAALRTVPERQRSELEPELRELVGDAIDARLAEGSETKAAERDALVRLGDPERLAAAYVERPLHLIGPRYYLDWLRLLKLLLAIVVPVTVLAVGLANAIDGKNVGSAIGEAIGVGLSVGVHLCFWMTLVFAVAERLPNKPSFTTWTPEMLTDVPRPRPGRSLGEMIVALVFLGLFAAALVWQQFFMFARDDSGVRTPVLDPALWSFWLPYLLVVIALEAVFAVILYLRHGWNWAFVGVNVLLNIVWVGPLLWLFTNDRLINPAFFHAVGVTWDGKVESIARPIVVAGLIVVAVFDVVDGVVKTWRAKR